MKIYTAALTTLGELITLGALITLLTLKEEIEDSVLF